MLRENVSETEKKNPEACRVKEDYISVRFSMLNEIFIQKNKGKGHLRQ